MIKNNQVESTVENIKLYFETYIESYKPYKNNPVYKAILDTLVDTYYKELYQDIPESLLDLTVKNIVNPKSNIDLLLIEIGLPEKLIQEFTVSEKWIFFQIFTDFMRYKSTISFFQMLGKVANVSMPERYNLYELWIDRKVDGTWILKPKIIYKSEVVEERTTPLSYDDVYNKLPHLLISSEQLTQLYDNRKLILPYKTNLILLDERNITNVDEISGLIRSVFLKTYGQYDIKLYFTDEIYVIPLEFVDKLWYYLIFRYFNTEQLSKQFDNVVLFSQQNSVFIDISQLSSIINQYENINSWNEYQAFYDQYIKPFKTDYNQQYVDQTSLFNLLVTKNSQIMAYIDKRISTATDPTLEIIIIMDEIYGSLLLSSINYSNDGYYQEYLSLYMNTLSNIFVNTNDKSFSKSFSSKIITNLKPFHTDVLLDILWAVQTNDKEFFNDKNKIIMKVNACSVLTLIDINYHIQFQKYISEKLPIITAQLYFLFILKNSSLKVLENIKKNVKYNVGSPETFSNIFKFSNKKYFSDSNKIISAQDYKVLSKYINLFELYDIIEKIDINKVDASILSMSDLKYLNLIKNISDGFTVISAQKQYFVSTFFNTFKLLDGLGYVTFIKRFLSLFSVSDVGTLINIKQTLDNLPIISTQSNILYSQQQTGLLVNDTNYEIIIT